jgi:hypothetical protein
MAQEVSVSPATPCINNDASASKTEIRKWSRPIALILSLIVICAGWVGVRGLPEQNGPGPTSS